MATVIASARFCQNFYDYIATHGWDLEFRKEVLFVMADPQCHPPKDAEQLTKWFDIVKIN